MLTVLKSIGCEVSVSGDQALVTPPSWRPDITHKTDLAEEVARLVGYDQIPSRLPVAPPGRGLTRRQQLRRRALSTLTAAGFTEVLNYPFLSDAQNSLFTSGESVVLENPMQGEFPELRKSLLPGLLLAAARNISRGNLDLALLEEGSVFVPAGGKAVASLPVGNQRPADELLAQLNASIPDQPRFVSGVILGNWTPSGVGQIPVAAGYAHAIDAVALIVQAAGLSIDLEQAEIAGFHPGRGAKVFVGSTQVGTVGELHPELATELHLPRRVALFELDLDALFKLAPEVLQAAELRVMPAATQDISLVVDQDISAATVLNELRAGAGDLLESISLVDDYRGQGLDQRKKSLTFALLFRASDRTLTQAEATQARDAAVALVNAKFGAELRA